MINLFNIIFLFVNLIKFYTVYNIFQVFFKEKRVSNIVEISSYAILFIATSIVFLKFSIPTLTLLTNIIMLLIITLNYKSSWKNRIVAVAATYTILWAIENTIFLLTRSESFSTFSKVEYDSISGIMILALANLVVSLMLKKFKNINKGNDTPLAHWAISLTIPILSIYVGHIALIAEGVSEIQLALSIIFILLINISMIVIYDIIAELTESKIQKAINEQRMLESQKQTILKLENYQILENFRHDQRNHMVTLKHLVQSGETKEAEKYIDKIRQIIYNSSEKISTGNLAIDNMLNCKLVEAENCGIDITIDNQIPSNLELDVFAMNIILGNLMDNAIEATSKLETQKEIKIDLSIKNESKLSIEIKNNYVGTIKHCENKIISSKKDKKNHGIGLKSVKQELEKMQGKFIIKEDSKNATFTVETIIPINLKN